MLRVIVSLLLLPLILIIPRIPAQEPGLVDGGTYRIQNCASGLFMTAQPSLGENVRLFYVKTDTWDNSRGQRWDLEFYSKDWTLTPDIDRENNVTLEHNPPNSPYVMTVHYRIAPVSPRPTQYEIMNKDKKLCLKDVDRVVILGPCDAGDAATWKFIR